MIEFVGELSGSCKSTLLRKMKKDMFFQSLIIVAGLTIIAVPLVMYLTKLLFVIVPLFAFILIISQFAFDKKSELEFFPVKITIDTDEGSVILLNGNGKERFHMFDSVERVLDYGEWYQFIFSFGEKDQFFICQKDLISTGTIEEFEAVFGKQIEKKYSN